MKDYKMVVNLNGTYVPIENQETHNKFISGVYEPWFDKQNDQWYFELIKFEHDQILDLPDPVYKQVVEEFNLFMKPETEQKFKQYGYLYKRSTLLYGLPGTGKTTIVNRLSNDLIKKGGIVLYNPVPQQTSEAIDIVRSLNPTTQIMVLFEELDEEIRLYGETAFLNLLDGEDQHNNIIYLATTNYLDKIPKRIQRPGRFSTVIEVFYPNKESREFYLRQKLPNLNETTLNEWINLTDGLSIDELSETVKATICLNQDLLVVIDRIKKLKGVPEQQPTVHHNRLLDPFIEPTELARKMLAKGQYHQDNY